MNLPITAPVMINPPPNQCFESGCFETEPAIASPFVKFRGEIMTRADWIRLRLAARVQGDIVKFNEANAALGLP